MATTATKLVSKLKTGNTLERCDATRNIWLKWENLENKETIKNEEDHILLLLEQDTGERNIWYYMIVLGLINSTKAIPIILDNLRNSIDENIRGFAAEALGKYKLENLTKEILRLLWQLASTDPLLVVRVNSIRAIANHFYASRNEDISYRFLKLLKEQSDITIRTAIMHEIGEIGSMAIVPDLIHILITRRTEMDIKITGSTLDKIALINGYSTREDLIQQFSEEIMKSSEISKE
ncbi:MAG: HEAT repeat domain-containing protein [Candidatus Kariarchaeaceae archaeon]|jgi:HEAT repeat protein